MKKIKNKLGGMQIALDNNSFYSESFETFIFLVP